MRFPTALCLLALGPNHLSAQNDLGIMLSLGMATAYGGAGPSASARLELPLHHVSGTVALVWGGTGWLAQTDVTDSRFGIKRNIKGIGPLAGLQWRPAASKWRLTLGGGVEYLWNRNEDPTIACAPPDDCGGSAPTDARHGADRTGPGAVLAARLTLPPQAGVTLEFGAAGIRHSLFDEAAWWTRFEVGFRFGLGGGEP